MRPLLLVALLASSFALGQEDEPRRHTGFSLRFDADLGYSSASAAGVTLSGASVGAGVSVGGALVENLILGGSVWFMEAVNPSLSAPGISGQTSNTTVGVWGVGPQLTCYLMPANVYVTGTAGIGRLFATVNGNTDTTDVGFAGKIAVGKEWLVGEHWGLGLAGQVLLTLNSESGANVNWTGFAFAMAFSATLN